MALPSMARWEVKPEIQGKIALLAKELGKVRFEVPEGFDGIQFWPLGTSTGNSEWPFISAGSQKKFDRLVVVSPFLTQGLLTRLNNQSHQSTALIPGWRAWISWLEQVASIALRISIC